MYLERKFLISEMCMISLMVVSLLRTWRRPLSSVFSPITTVKSTPIWSYLKCIDIETHIRNTTKITAFASITALNCTLLCVQLLHWCQSFKISRPHTDLSLHKLLQQPLTHLQNNQILINLLWLMPTQWTRLIKYLSADSITVTWKILFTQHLIQMWIKLDKTKY